MGIRTLSQAVQGQQVQAGRAVDEDEVIVLLHLGQGLPQPAFAAGQIHHFKRSPGQPGIGGDDVGTELGFADGLAGLSVLHQQFIGAHLHAPLGDAVTGGGVALGVQIHDQNLFAQGRHTGRQIDGGGRLAHAALLVCDSHNFTH